MVTIEEMRSDLQTAVNDAKSAYNTIVAEQLASYPFNDTTAWDALTTDEKMAEYSRKTVAEGIIGINEKALANFEAKVAEFIPTREAAFAQFQAEKQAAFDVLAAEWQDKEDYRNANADDLDLVNFG